MSSSANAVDAEEARASNDLIKACVEGFEQILLKKAHEEVTFYNIADILEKTGTMIYKVHGLDERVHITDLAARLRAWDE